MPDDGSSQMRVEMGHTPALPRPIDHFSWLSVLADVLRLPDESLACAYLYFNRYRRFIANSDEPDRLDAHTLALASLSLATKSTESPRRLRELLLPAHRFLHSSNPAAPPLTLTSPLYAVLRATVVQAEMMLLRVLRFSIRMPIALHHLPRYLVRAIGDGDTAGGYDGLSEDHKDEYKIGALMDTALARAVAATTVNAYKDYHLANFYPARAVAATCLYRVLQQRGLQVTDQDGKVEGWLDDVTGGKVEREEFDEILARLT